MASVIASGSYHHHHHAYSLTQAGPKASNLVKRWKEYFPMEAEQIEDFARGYKTFENKGWSEEETVNVLRLMTAVGATTSSPIRGHFHNRRTVKGQSPHLEPIFSWRTLCVYQASSY